ERLATGLLELLRNFSRRGGDVALGRFSVDPKGRNEERRGLIPELIVRSRPLLGQLGRGLRRRRLLALEDDVQPVVELRLGDRPAIYRGHVARRHLLVASPAAGKQRGSADRNQDGEKSSRVSQCWHYKA